jgi:hypothetical protein
MNPPVNGHPTIAAIRARQTQPPKTSEPLDAVWLRQLCLDAGADDVGFVEADRPALAGEHPHIQRAFPRTRSLISFVLRMNRDNVRSPARSVANSEFHNTGDEVNDVAFGPNYKAAYCMAVCPADEDVIGPYLASKKDFADEVMRPLQAKREPVYVASRTQRTAHGPDGFVRITLTHMRLRIRTTHASPTYCLECRFRFNLMPLANWTPLIISFSPATSRPRQR